MQPGGQGVGRMRVLGAIAACPQAHPALRVAGGGGPLPVGQAFLLGDGTGVPIERLEGADPRAQRRVVGRGLPQLVGGAQAVRPTALLGQGQMVVGGVAIADHHARIALQQAVQHGPGAAGVVGGHAGGGGSGGGLGPYIPVLAVLAPAGLVHVLARAGPRLGRHLRPHRDQRPAQPAQQVLQPPRERCSP